MAEATKVNVRFLEALERNDFQSLHGGLYNRGIVRAYCEFIGADAESMVNAYLLEERNAKERTPGEESGLLRGGGAALRPESKPEASRGPRLSRPLLLVLVLGALVASFLLYIRFMDAGEPVPGEADPGAIEAPSREPGEGSD